MAGLGFAPEPVPSPAAPSSAPSLDVLGVSQNTAAPLAGLTRTQKIGALLQNFGRGVQGQGSYTDELLKQRQDQELMELKRLDVGIGAMTKGMELLKNTPAGQRESMAKQYGAMFEHILPGFTDTFTAASQQPEVTQEMMDALGEHADTLIKVGGSLEGALKLAQNPAFMAQLKEAADERNAPEIVQAFQRGRDMMQQSPEAKALWDEAAKDGLTIADLQDPTFRDALGLTENHVRTIMRSPELQSNLREFGFKTTKDLDAEAGKELDQRYAKDTAAAAGAEAAAREAAKIIPYIGRDGTVIREPQGMRHELAKQGFSPMVTGRTDADLTAMEEAQEKDAADKSVPVDPYFARLAEVDTNMTKQEAIDAGLTPDIDDTTKRALQGAETGARNMSALIGQARTIIQNNPDANTRVAQLGGLVTTLRAELGALGKATGVKIDIDRELKGREDIFKANGIDNALMKQLAIGLAYMNAKSLDDSGRLSDADVRNSAKALGASASDPDVLLNLLDQAEMTADESFRNRVQASTGARRKSMLPDVQAAEDINARAEAGETVTPDEIQSLTPRALRHLKTLRAGGSKKKTVAR